MRDARTSVRTEGVDHRLAQCLPISPAPTPEAVERVARRLYEQWYSKDVEMPPWIDAPEHWKEKEWRPMARAALQAAFDAGVAAHDCQDVPLIAGCIAVVAEINRRWGATSYVDAIATVERRIEEAKAAGVARAIEWYRTHNPDLYTAAEIAATLHLTPSATEAING